jgi:hypothetical protein
MMENKNEIIVINDTTNIKTKVKKSLTEAKKSSKINSHERLYEKNKSDPKYIERQRLSSRTHYCKHKDEVSKRMKEY